MTLSFDDISTRKHMALQNEFEAVFIAFAAPTGAGMFQDRDHTRSHGYYFSPNAVAIASSMLAGYGAVECPAPRQSEVGILVAHAGLEGVPFAPET